MCCSKYIFKFSFWCLSHKRNELPTTYVKTCVETSLPSLFTSVSHFNQWKLNINSFAGSPMCDSSWRRAEIFEIQYDQNTFLLTTTTNYSLSTDRQCNHRSHPYDDLLPPLPGGPDTVVVDCHHHHHNIVYFLVSFGFYYNYNSSCRTSN